MASFETTLIDLRLLLVLENEATPSLEGPTVRIRFPPAASRTNVDRGAHRLGIEPRRQNLRDAALEDKIVERAMVPSAKG